MDGGSILILILMRSTIMRFLFNRLFFQKLFVLTLLGIIIISFREFVVPFLITFLFAYLFLDIGTSLHDRLARHTRQVPDGWLRTVFVRLTSVNSIVTMLYIGFIAIVVLVFSTFIPRLVEEGSTLAKNLPSIIGTVRDTIQGFEDHFNLNIGINNTLA